MNPTVTIYEPPISRDEDARRCNYWACAERQLAQGVKGFAFEEDGLILIPLIVAEREGSGDVGRFLDRLSPRCRIVTCTSARLAGMLARRGWKKHRDEEYGDIWRRA